MKYNIIHPLKQTLSRGT